MSESYDWGRAVDKLEGQPGVHWLGDVEESKLYAEIYYDAVVVNEMTMKEDGRPIYEDKLHIRIYMPGGDITTRRFEEIDKQRFRLAWQAFERGEAQVVNGTPLKEWPMITPAALATLTNANIRSIEGLAELADPICEKIGAVAFDYRDKAKAYLEKAGGQSAEVNALKTQNQAMAELLQKSQDQIAALEAKVEAIGKPKRRGRPPGSRTKVKRNVPSNNDPGDNQPAESADT